MIVDINGNVQLIDFDLAHRSHNEEGGKKLEVFCGTPHIACPEIWRAEPYHGEKADVWSLGVILYVLLVGAYPYDGEDLEELREDILESPLEIPRDLPSPMKDLLLKMLDKDPNTRISTAELSEHPVVIGAGVTSACVRHKLSGKRSISENENRHSSSGPVDEKTESKHAKDVAHEWEAPVVEKKRVMALSRELSNDDLLAIPDQLPQNRSKRPRLAMNSQPNTPMWEVRGPSPRSTHSPSAPSPKPPVSPSRKTIFEALDYLLDEPTEGLSADARRALLSASTKDDKIASMMRIESSVTSGVSVKPTNTTAASSKASSDSSTHAEKNNSSGPNSFSPSVSSQGSSTPPEDLEIGTNHMNREDGKSAYSGFAHDSSTNGKKSDGSRNRYIGSKRKIHPEDHQVMAAEVVSYVFSR
mmetsp:Transcript_4316/g.6145  ORF Transcript_4316/g.6145 Transcript_4316/m.6145 type:complete len:415 (+) Transcript_4316:198-1442(+)